MSPSHQKLAAIQEQPRLLPVPFVEVASGLSTELVTCEKAKGIRRHSQGEMEIKGMKKADLYKATSNSHHSLHGRLEECELVVWRAQSHEAFSLGSHVLQVKWEPF